MAICIAILNWLAMGCWALWPALLGGWGLAKPLADPGRHTKNSTFQTNGIYRPDGSFA